MTRAGTRGRSQRTQEERTTETRAKLLDATIESILEVGYAQTTTRLVAERAGVSAGAQSHHFPRRVDLVVAAAERLVERRIDADRRRAKRIAGLPERERVPAVLDLMWADFASPTFAVLVKLWVAAGDYPELHSHLVAGERQLARAITALAGQALGERASAKDAEGKLLLVFSACRGLALTEHFEPRGRRRKDRWPPLREELLAALDSDP